MAPELRGLRGHVGEPLPEFVLRVMRATGLEVEASLGAPDVGGAAAARPARLPRPRVGVHRARRPADARRLPRPAARRGALRHRPRARRRRSGRCGAAAHRAQGEGARVRLRVRAVRGRGRLPRRARAVAVADQCQHRAVAAARRLHRRARLLPRRRRGPAGQALRRVQDGPAPSSPTLESQRLAYVAFTRAERGLAVSGHWWGPSQSTRRGPDGFLSTVHEACLDGVRRGGALGAGRPRMRVNPVGPGGRGAAGLAARARTRERRARLLEVGACRVGGDGGAARAAGRRRRCQRSLAASASRPGAHPGVGRPGGGAARGGARAARARARRSPARRGVGEHAHARARGARRGGPRARPSDAATAGPGGTSWHGVPRLGRDPVRAAVAARSSTTCRARPTPTSPATTPCAS